MIDADVGARAQRAAEEHLARCYEAMHAWEEGEDETESPACAPFCGCDTCIVREVLYAAWPIIPTLLRPSSHDSKPHSEPLQENLDAIRAGVSRLQENWQGKPEVVYAISDVQAGIEALVPVVRKLQAERDSLEEQLQSAEAFIAHQDMSYRYAEWTSNPASSHWTQEELDALKVQAAERAERFGWRDSNQHSGSSDDA